MTFFILYGFTWRFDRGLSFIIPAAGRICSIHLTEKGFTLAGPLTQKGNYFTGAAA